MGRLRLFLPLIIFVVLALVLFGVERRVERGEYQPTDLPSALIGQPFPDFSLPALLQERMLSAEDLQGQYALVNVWATWCPSCHFEHPWLMRFAESGKMPVFGVNYKDKDDKARVWLQEKGNPYQAIIVDQDGRLGLDLGVTGAPETYLIDPQGTVLLRYMGPLDDKVWARHFAPLLPADVAPAEPAGAAAGAAN